MAMNKKEKSELETLRESLRIARAFKFTEPVEPDIPPPDHYSKLTKGWSFHFSDVYKACSSSIYHGDGWEKTTSQNPIHLYSSEVLALRALRYEVEQRYAKHLADIDRRIEGSKAKAGEPATANKTPRAVAGSVPAESQAESDTGRAPRDYNAAE